MAVLDTLPTLAAGAAGHHVSSIDRGNAEWYKDAIIYQLHVKAFQDSDGDGVGDFAGLIQRLDYIQELGVTAIWLLPFYPSPLKDDGYDIADYEAINPAFGTLDDFRAFVAAAHDRGIRVITELVINHTSEMHPWFQRARKAPPGSPERDFYVWSETDQKYKSTRIIFCDTEASNWTWDGEAKSYYWHRFYAHQPDLNFANPAVLNEILKAMHFWLDLGVDGLRLDAVPYLCEREGTNNENLPETHEILRKIRRDMDSRYCDRMLLAEANQWPEDTRPYFGQGDECHMAFHFPLMPRMYMALAQEDRHPITDIIRQTPEIPDCCQWALFLRNHDELTLEMVTDEERDYLWRTYAADPRARINLGIRRRLAALMDNDRRKIELMNALLLSMPGTPVVYYGDEIGMGDNYYLGDRDGVRTPMQWSIDRNGGFSRADPQRLFLPPLMDPIYGYQAVNVESQQKSPSSLLNWMRRAIGVRKSHKALGRGTLTFLYPRNRKILAFLREFEDERILCVANLSRTAQALELDLAQFRGMVPVELTGRSPFPPIGDLPYLLTLPAFGFYWFLLASEAEVPRWHVPAPDPVPELITVVTSEGWHSVLSGRELRNLERYSLPDFLPRQRWFSGRNTERVQYRLRPLCMIAVDGEEAALTCVDATAEDGHERRYFLPLIPIWGEEHLRFGAPKLPYTVAKLRRGSRVAALVDAAYKDEVPRALMNHLRAGTTVAGSDGIVRFSATAALRALELSDASRVVGAEQSNVALVLGERVLLKIYRRLQAGVQPDIEIARYLTETIGFTHTPAYLGHIAFENTDGEETALASAFAFVPNQGDGWSVTTDALKRYAEEESLAHPVRPLDAAEPFLSFPLDLGALLGRRLGELHGALSRRTGDMAFDPEPVSADDVGAWVAALKSEAVRAFRNLHALRGGDAGAPVGRLLAKEAEAMALLDTFARLPPSGLKCRIHGDFHLGQVLIAQGDIAIIDFEGEPQRTLAERRQKSSPLRDVAGLLRSFDYAALSTLAAFEEDDVATQDRSRALVLQWRDKARRGMLEAYIAAAGACAAYPPCEMTAARLLELFLLEKVFYEINYEVAHRPGWVGIPVRGALELLSRLGARL